MTSDQEPRYRLVDANGNIVGSLYGKPDGSVAIQETGSGADREVALAPDGTFSAPSVETESVSTEKGNIDNVTLQQGTVSDITIHSGDLVSLGAAEYATIFDSTEPTDVLSGSVHGGEVDEFRITWSDDSTEVFRPTNSRGNTDENNETLSVFPVPSIVDLKKLEIRASASGVEIGWVVYTL